MFPSSLMYQRKYFLVLIGIFDWRLVSNILQQYFSLLTSSLTPQCSRNATEHIEQCTNINAPNPNFNHMKTVLTPSTTLMSILSFVGHLHQIREWLQRWQSTFTI